MCFDGTFPIILTCEETEMIMKVGLSWRGGKVIPL